MIFQRLHDKKALFLDQLLFAHELEVMSDHQRIDLIVENWAAPSMVYGRFNTMAVQRHDPIQCCQCVQRACQWTIWH